MKSETLLQEKKQVDQEEKVSSQENQEKRVISDKEKENSQKESLSEMKAEVAGQIASVVFTDIIGPLNYYLPRIADEAERNRLEMKRQVLRARIGNYFKEDKPLIPSGGFVSKKMEQDLQGLRQETEVLLVEIDKAYEEGSREIGRKIEETEEVKTEDEEISKEGVSIETKEGVVTDARPTKIMQISEKEKEWIAAAQKEKGLFHPIMKKIKGFFAKLRKTKEESEVIRESSVDARPTRVDMPAWEGSEQKDKAEKGAEKESRQNEIEQNMEVIQTTSSVEVINSPDHPDQGQDQTLNDDKNNIFGVFDGMGGRLGGEVASATAKSLMHNHISSKKGGLKSIGDAEKLMQDAMTIANNEILNQQRSDFGALDEMGTTATVAFVFEGNLIVGQLGDSRLYLGRGEKIQKITTDDSHVPPELSEKFDNVINPKEELSDDELTYWRGRNSVKQVLGRSGAKAAISVVKIEQGDSLLLTSDGVHDNLTKNEIEGFLKKSDLKGLVSKAHKMAENDFDFSKSADGIDVSKRDKFDDISAVMVEVK